MGIVMDCFIISQIGINIKERKGKVIVFIKIKNKASSKNIIKKINRQTRDWRKHSQKIYLTYFCGTYQETLQVINNMKLKKIVKNWNIYFQRKINK